MLKKIVPEFVSLASVNLKHFLNEYLPAQPGRSKPLTEKQLATTMVLMFYTIGQRQGLQIGGVKRQSGSAMVCG